MASVPRNPAAITAANKSCWNCLDDTWDRTSSTNATICRRPKTPERRIDWLGTTNKTWAYLGHPYVHWYEQAGTQRRVLACSPKCRSHTTTSNPHKGGL